MYINPFWLGVITTVLVEIVGFMIFAIIAAIKGGKK